MGVKGWRRTQYWGKEARSRVSQVVSRTLQHEGRRGIAKERDGPKGSPNELEGDRIHEQDSSHPALLLVCDIISICYPQAFMLKQSFVLVGTGELKERHVTTLRPRGLYRKTGSSPEKLLEQGQEGSPEAQSRYLQWGGCLR